MKHSGWRLAAIALLAILVRAVMPSGYMLGPAETSSGRFMAMSLCSAPGQPAYLVDLATGHAVDRADLPDSHEPSDNSQHCVFSLAQVAVAPELRSEPAECFTPACQPAPAMVHAVRPGQGIAAPPPPSTGPPAQA